MPSRPPDSRLPHDSDDRPAAAHAAEPGNPDMRQAENATAPQDDAHAGYDADLNPIDDEFINTHGSER